jgi:uncharacterized protein YbbC (DUF1343 family)
MGTLCKGAQAHIKDREILKPLEAGLSILEVAMESNEFEWVPPFIDGGGHFFIDMLAGCDLLRQKNGFEKYRAACEADVIIFNEQRKKYLIYPNEREII